MSSFLCFICHSTVNSDTKEETREKYREVVGMNLCPDSHLCHICCHVLDKLWMFRSVCLKRSLEYPVLFSEKGTINLQRNDLEFHTICAEDACGQYHNRNINSKSYNFNFDCDNYDNSQEFDPNNQYVELEDERTDFDDYFNHEHVTHTKATLFEDQRPQPDFNEEFVDNIPNLYPKHNDYNYVREDIIKNIDTRHDTNFHLDKEVTETPLNVNERKIEDYNYVGKEDVKNTETEVLENTDETADIDETTVDTEQTIPESPIPSPESKESITPEDIGGKDVKKKKKSKKIKYEKIILSLEQQKADLESRRKEKKYLEAEFKCYNCALGFLFKDTYQTHMMRHEESNGEYRCATCTLRFATAGVLRAHAQAHAARYRCTRCACALTPRQRPAHHRCARPRPATLARAGPRPRPEPRACHLCAATLRDANGLQQHLKRFHQAKNSNKTYSCSVCGKTYNNQAAVRTHMIKHINRKFNCDKCPSTFSSPYTLTQHKKKHDTEAKQYYCEACQVGYSSKKSLLAHKRNSLQHQQAIFECPICSRICANSRSLASHVESVHSGTKDYACPSCPARYSNRKSLIRHMGTHQARREPKLAVCHLCGASFKGNNKLNRHLREVCEKAKMEEELANLYDQELLNAG